MISSLSEWIATGRSRRAGSGIETNAHLNADGRITSRRRSFGNAIVSRWPILWSRGVMLPKTRMADTFDLQLLAYQTDTTRVITFMVGQ